MWSTAGMTTRLLLLLLKWGETVRHLVRMQTGGVSMPARGDAIARAVCPHRHSRTVRGGAGETATQMTMQQRDAVIDGDIDTVMMTRAAILARVVAVGAHHLQAMDGDGTATMSAAIGMTATGDTGGRDRDASRIQCLCEVVRRKCCAKCGSSGGFVCGG